MQADLCEFEATVVYKNKVRGQWEGSKDSAQSQGMGRVVATPQISIWSDSLQCRSLSGVGVTRMTPNENCVTQ